MHTKCDTYVFIIILLKVFSYPMHIVSILRYIFIFDRLPNFLLKHLTMKKRKLNLSVTVYSSSVCNIQITMQASHLVGGIVKMHNHFKKEPTADCTLILSAYYFIEHKLYMNKLWWFFKFSYFCDLIGDVMVSVLASSAVDRGFESRSGQTIDYEIDSCCFSAKHTVLRRKSKDWLAQNQDNVSEWGDMSISGLSFQWASTIKIQRSVLV